MAVRISSSLVVVVTLTYVANLGAQTWTEFTSDEGQFRAAFPGKPEKSASKDGDTISTQWSVAMGRTAFNVSCTDVGGESKVATPQNVYKLKVAVLAKQAKEKRDIKLNGVPGVEFVIDSDEGGGVKLTSTVRVFLVDRRIYQAIVVHEQGAKEGANVRRFLDSFRVQGKGHGKEKQGGI